MNIYICEDDEKQREFIEKCVNELIIEKDLKMQCITATGEPEEILEIVREQKEQGLFFLDVDLNCEMNGIELANQIRKYQPRCFVVFITSHSEMSYMTYLYKVEAMDFIIKDNYSEIKKRICQCMEKCDFIYNQLDDGKEKNFFVRINDYVKAVPYQDILYFEVSDRCRKLILHGFDIEIEFAGQIKDLMTKLDKRFLRCHKSYIVNKDNIERVVHEKNIIILRGGAICPISVRMGKTLLK